MKLWEGLEQDFNYNAMVSQRGVLNLYHSDAQRDAAARRGNAMRLHGVDAELLDRDAVRRNGAVPRFRQCALSDPGRVAAAARRHGAARRRRVGLCARCGHARRRHHRELRSDRVRHRGRLRVSVSKPRAARSRRARSASRSPATPRGVGVAGRTAAADRKPRAAGLRVRRHQAGDRQRRDVRRRAFLHQPVRQGRARVRRRYRRLQLLCVARQSAGGRGRDGRRHGDLAGARPHPHAARSGAG